MKPLIIVALSTLLLAACGARPSAAPSLTQTPLRVVTSAPTPTTFVMPTPPPSPTATCPGAPRERLVLGERGRVLPDDPRSVNVRAEPGTDSDILTQMPINAIFTVLEGPVCGENYSWYRISYRESDGWIAEGDLTSYYVEPYLVN
ncbi:MAG: SH3 domain-containing protein [Anaerolineae bacterium]